MIGSDLSVAESSQSQNSLSRKCCVLENSLNTDCHNIELKHYLSHAWRLVLPACPHSPFAAPTLGVSPAIDVVKSDSIKSRVFLLKFRYIRDKYDNTKFNCRTVNGKKQFEKFAAACPPMDPRC